MVLEGIGSRFREPFRELHLLDRMLHCILIEGIEVSLMVPIRVGGDDPFHANPISQYLGCQFGLLQIQIVLGLLKYGFLLLG